MAMAVLTDPLAPDPLSPDGLADLPRGVHVLRWRDPSDPFTETTYYIVGTAHVSQQSCEDVRAVIRAVRPQVVMVELCHERRSILTMDEKDLRVPTVQDMVAQYRSGQVPVFQIFYAWMLAKFSEHLEVFPGAEFRVALREAQTIGAKVVLGDRTVSITIARVWAALGFWQRLRLLWYILSDSLSLPDRDELEKFLNEMRDSDMLTEAIKEMGKEFPSLVTTLITERDRYMTCTLRRLSAPQHKTVVAVVGAGHTPGIKEHWELEIDEAELVVMPAKRQAHMRHYVAIGIATSAVVAVLVVRWRRR